MASKENSVEGSTSAGSTKRVSPASRGRRGRPQGNKNRATLMREAAGAAAAREREARLRTARESAIGEGVSNAPRQGRRILEEGEGSRPSWMPSLVQEILKGAVITPVPLHGAGGSLDLPIHEFFVNVASDSHSRLPLPALFNLIFDRYVQGSATIREASPRQRPWVVAVERDADGPAAFAGAWREFALHYELQSPSTLLFRHREGTSEFMVKVFVGGCRSPSRRCRWSEGDGSVRDWRSFLCCLSLLSISL